ncbi:MAG: DUF362 domain-containing protein [Candidatus Omnitrophota bacterium]|nr:DUF362 domain-containing protein [Candidatus Omnitrophota bacterium]
MEDLKSNVYYIKVDESHNPDEIRQRLARLLKESKILDFIKENNKVAVKLHFGEEGNTGFVKPQYLRVVCDHIRQNSALPFLSDANTLYRGRRDNCQDHLELSQEHGFTREAVGVDVIIPDDAKKENIAEVKVDGKFITTAKVVKSFLDADVLIGVAHFKGHIMAGFGGALKNIGMGCATREGKLAQHSHICPFVIMQKCTGCSACLLVCPVKAITLKDNLAFIDSGKCIGCSSCIAACKFHSIDIPWEQGGVNIQERMVEYAKAILDSHKKRAAFINFATKITAECDCLAKDDPRISPDIGIFASTDPAAIDKAAMDLVLKVCKKDVFKEAHPKRDGMRQLSYAASLGLGSLDYRLIEIS